jgi:hypothetical protein
LHKTTTQKSNITEKIENKIENKIEKTEQNDPTNFKNLKKSELSIFVPNLSKLTKNKSYICLKPNLELSKLLKIFSPSFSKIGQNSRSHHNNCQSQLPIYQYGYLISDSDGYSVVILDQIDKREKVEKVEKIEKTEKIEKIETDNYLSFSQNNSQINYERTDNSFLSPPPIPSNQLPPATYSLNYLPTDPIEPYTNPPQLSNSNPVSVTSRLSRTNAVVLNEFKIENYEQVLPQNEQNEQNVSIISNNQEKSDAAIPARTRPVRNAAANAATKIKAQLEISNAKQKTDDNGINGSNIVKNVKFGGNNGNGSDSINVKETSTQKFQNMQNNRSNQKDLNNDYCNIVNHFNVIHSTDSYHVRDIFHNFDKFDKFDNFDSKNDSNISTQSQTSTTTSHITVTRILVISTEAHATIALSTLAALRWSTTLACDNLSAMVAVIPPQ